jgi:hypothetical protein
MKHQRKIRVRNKNSYITFSFETPACQNMSLGIEVSLLNWQLQNNGKKGIRLWKEDFMCYLKLK